MVRHSKEGRRYVYKPAITPRKAKRTALNNLLQTFFDGKPENLVASAAGKQPKRRRGRPRKEDQ